MGTYTAQWEDEENNRIVELAVRYKLDGSEVEIESVIPASVTFIQAETREVIRQIRVHTEKGRRMLRKSFMRCCGLEAIEQELSTTLLATA
jgi:hypothetical protein